MGLLGAFSPSSLSGGPAFSLVRVCQADVEVPELIAADWRWCANHGVGSTLGLGKGYHLPDVGLASQEHHQAIDARGDAAVGWRAEFKRLEHVAKLLFGIFDVKPDQLEHLFLDLTAVDPDAPATNLIIVADQVMLLAPNSPGVCVEQRDILRHGGGEEMVVGVPSVLIFIPGEKGPIKDPGHGQHIVVPQAQPVGQLHAQASQSLCDDGRLVGDKEQQVTRPALHALDEGSHGLRGEELGKGQEDRRGQ